ncbi:hypothetical protein BD310DRAFT_915940 [Dichomitus squalens]|uniref:Uncharacterized protein n=1 Tax=Dichomitus squalens TaxID=114155 RepID=A0A4Q9Q8E1_9APHY|nr:hypothetical protein BD310DRAFT_915940 [Dichomitus squalens]
MEHFSQEINRPGSLVGFAQHDEACSPRDPVSQLEDEGRANAPRAENVSGQRVPGTGDEGDPTRVEYAILEDAAQERKTKGGDEEHITEGKWRNTQKAEPCSVLVGSMSVTRQDDLDEKVAFLQGTLSHKPTFLENAGDDAYEMWTQGVQTEVQRGFRACEIAKTYKVEGAPKDDSNPDKPQLPAIVAEELMRQSIATVLRPSGPLVLGGALDAYECSPEVAAYMRTEREEPFNRLRQLESNARPEAESVQDSEEDLVEDSEEQSGVHSQKSTCG